MLANLSFIQGRTLADLTDRHYGLFANNQHPLQLECYASYNQFLADLHDIQEARRNEEFNSDYQARLEAAEANLDAANGETLSLEDKEDIYMDAKADQRARENMSRNARGRDGEINDYLELRRPFGAAQ